MAALFEEFVRSFYRHEQHTYSVRKALFSWNVHATTDALQHLPGLATDVTLISPDRTLVIETKYYNKPLVERFGQRKIRSGHLYKLYSYLRNSPPSPDKPTVVEGILLYPVVEDSFDWSYNLDGYPLRVYALNLDQHWTAIRADLLSLLATSSRLSF